MDLTRIKNWLCTVANDLRFEIWLFCRHHRRRIKLACQSSLRAKIRKLSRQFRKSPGYELNLTKPRTFNEKLQWLKLFYDHPLVSLCGDKYQVRNYVKEQIGEQYLVPHLHVWDKPQDIDFNALPQAFVLKVNWGSSQNIIVRNKATLDCKQAIRKLRAWMMPESCHYYYSYEPSYFGFPPKIVCEEYVGELDGNLTCYKVFNFSGKPYLIQAVYDDKTPHETINYYDLEWNRLDLRQNYPNNPHDMPAPKHLAEMLMLAEKLAKPFPYFVRTDFYETSQGVLFSEFTFFSDNGTAPFYPREWDDKLGELIHLPEHVRFPV